ncbi:MAG: efflux RND transporter periplasmic adaptor subunit [Tannerellaceae bacterium]|jgi:multidrug efflux pump subunit AcrA (membrane-fusion protein)|nr:efflux RND transporter periplasmic adaptor subunit [Tannerellaceae bacterium]
MITINEYKLRLIGLFLLPVIISGGCDGGAKEPEGGKVETILPESTSEVNIITLKATDFHHELLSNGKLVASQCADLHFESAEPVVAIWVANGEEVTKGQKIAELSSFRLDNRAEQARNTLDKAYLELQDVLIGQGFSPGDSLAVPPEVRRLADVRSGYAEALAHYNLAVYEREQAVLRAPFDGVVANLFAKPWNMSAPGEVFCSIINTREAEASFTVLESELPLIRKGDSVEVSPFFDLESGSAAGIISEINPIVEEGGVVRVKASIKNPGFMTEGMNVRISVRRSLGRQLVVPKTAVVIRSGKQVVFTLVGGKAYWNYVSTSLENSDSFTVSEGLKEGDIVITGGNINLAHESAVTVHSLAR